MKMMTYKICYTYILSQLFLSIMFFCFEKKCFSSGQMIFNTALAPKNILQSDLQRINELFDYVYQYDHNYAPSSHLNDVWRRPPDTYFIKLLNSRNQPITDPNLLLDESRIFLERETDTNRVIGFAVCGNDWQKNKDAAYLAHMVIDLEYFKNMGYGSKLIGRVIAATKNSGKSKLKFEVRNSTGRAGFYEAYANKNNIPFSKTNENEQTSYVFDLINISVEKNISHGKNYSILSRA